MDSQHVGLAFQKYQVASMTFHQGISSVQVPKPSAQWVTFKNKQTKQNMSIERSLRKVRLVLVSVLETDSTALTVAPVPRLSL